MLPKRDFPILLCAGLLLAGFVWQGKANSISFDKEIKPIVKKHCLSCHSGKNAPAKIDLSIAKIPPAVWLKAESQVSRRLMPPPGQPKLPDVARATFSKWVKANYKPADCEIQDPGRVTMRRLNRNEYQNTIRDLLYVKADLTSGFPNDDVGYGFDNIGDVLSISSLQMEKYLDAAEKAAELAIQVPQDTTTRVDLSELKSEQKVFAEANMLAMLTNADLTYTRAFDRAGTYRIRVEAAATQGGDEPTKLILSVDKKQVAAFDVLARKGKPQAYEAPIALTAGQHQIGIRFPNDYFDPGNQDPNKRDRNLYIAALLITAPPIEQSSMPRFHQKVLAGPPPEPDKRSATAKRIFADFLRRAYRRPPDASDVELLMRCYGIAEKEGQPFEMGIRLGIQAALVSPNFLFRVEPDAKPLTSHAIASRLSYFLWSTMPDPELDTLADSKEILKPEVIAKQVKRMLADPRSGALADNFAAQWLQLRKLTGLSFDTELFPEFSPSLRASMVQESKLFFQAVVRENRPVSDFLAGNFTYVNKALADLYGIPGVAGDTFQKVSLASTPRAGILTQAAVLAVTSNPTRTSPVKRGKWILEEILGTPPPPPPPGVDTLDEDRSGVTGLTLKQRLEKHRKNPACAVCHLKMDALGFGFENFDPIGRWRTTDRGLPIDAGGTLPDGAKFVGPQQLTQILVKNKDEFVRCLSEKLLTYALGRGLSDADSCALDDIVKATKKGEYRFSSLIQAIAASEPFLKRTVSKKDSR